MIKNLEKRNEQLERQLIFEKGNILEFSKQILNFTKKNHNKWLKETKTHRTKLLLKYSKEIETNSIRKMIKKIVNLIN